MVFELSGYLLHSGADFCTQWVFVALRGWFLHSVDGCGLQEMFFHSVEGCCTQLMVVAFSEMLLHSVEGCCTR